MTVSLPVPLMTAAERAGFRAACVMIRAEGQRMRRAGALINARDPRTDPVAIVHQAQKLLLLDLCGKAVEMCADRALSELPDQIN